MIESPAITIVFLAYKSYIFSIAFSLERLYGSFIENILIQVRGDEENAAFQIANEVNSLQISPPPESTNDGTENTGGNHIQQNKEKDCATMETLKYDPSAMNEKFYWICAEIEKIPDRSRKQIQNA